MSYSAELNAELKQDEQLYAVKYKVVLLKMVNRHSLSDLDKKLSQNQVSQSWEYDLQSWEKKGEDPGIDTTSS